MNYFLVEFELPQPLPAELIALIPEQRSKVDELLHEQKILSYSLALDRSKAWAVVSATDLFEALHSVTALPIAQFSEPIVTELAFYNASRFVFPAISPN